MLNPKNKIRVSAVAKDTGPFRTTPDAVKSIIDFDPSIDDITPFINTANSLVTEQCALITTYDDVRLELIERWLSAHFIAVRDPRYVAENIGAAGGSYQQGQIGANLAATTYGQQVLLLDSAGGLARISEHVAKGKRGTVGVKYVGNNCHPDNSCDTTCP